MENSAVFNVRMDIRAVATLHRHFKRRGLEFSSVSTLTRHTVEYFADRYVESFGAEPFASVADATNYLESQGLLGALKTRGSSALKKALQAESLELEGIDPSYLKRKSVVSEDQIAKAKEILQNRQADECSGAILGPKPGEVKKGE